MKIQNQNILMESGRTVDGRDVSEDGKKLDEATFRNIANTLVMRDNSGYADVTSSSTLKLNIPRKFTFFGDLDASFLFDGTKDLLIEVNIRDDSHTHNQLYYTKAEIDKQLSMLSVGDHIHSIIRSGDGIQFFNYNGSVNKTVSAAFQGIGDDWGMETKYVSRSDHLHNKSYYPRNEALESFIVKLDFINDSIRVLDGLNNVHNSIQVPWALRLGYNYGLPGLSLNSTILNDENNVVVRTDSQGNTRFKNIYISANNTTSNISKVYVDTGDGFVKRCDLSHIFNQNQVSGNNVSQHGHSTLWTTNYSSQYYIYSDIDSDRYCRIKTNYSGNGISVDHADLATRAKYADLAELYSIKNYNNIKEGTILSVSSNIEYELEECDIYCCKNIVGVISSEPGFILNAKDESKEECKPVAIKGKNPVRVLGSILKGQVLISIGDGRAKATSGIIEEQWGFAYALESNENENEKLVYCFIK